VVLERRKRGEVSTGEDYSIDSATKKERSISKNLD